VPEFLRPPPHRGPLIAAGAVVLALGIALEELRLGEEIALGGHLVILAAAAALILSLGLQAPIEDGRPPAYQSVLLVTGLLLLYAALLRLADVIGADFEDFPAGAFTWTALIECGVALWAALQKRSAICLLLAAIAAGIAVLSGLVWIFDPSSFTAARWLLLVMAVAFTLASLRLRAVAERHAEVLVVAAGLAILVIGLQGLLQAFPLFGPAGVQPMSNFWELVLVVGGCGLIAYGAVDRAPGPAWLGVATLATFVGIVTRPNLDDTLYWWPFLLVLIGAGAMIAGLRPARPLPPEPDAYRAGEQPLASRTADDEVVVRVRDDSPPPGR
jgi:hypothetical protein